MNNIQYLTLLSFRRRIACPEMSGRRNLSLLEKISQSCLLRNDSAFLSVIASLCLIKLGRLSQRCRNANNWRLINGFRNQQNLIFCFENLRRNNLTAETKPYYLFIIPKPLLFPLISRLINCWKVCLTYEWKWTLLRLILLSLWTNKKTRQKVWYHSKNQLVSFRK